MTRPTDWCSQISVQTKKSGKLCICIDPRPLNEVLQRETYPLPTIHDLLPELANAKVFSKVDLSNGYWHCKLDHTSSLLTTFIAPQGRYRWLRLPFGTKVSSKIFQRKLNESLEGLKGIVCVADDILIFGISQEDHDENLRNLLIRCEERNLKLNKGKCVFNTAELDFLGHVVTNKGLKPDQKKIEAILQMPNPTDVEGVRRLQGMITYLAKFIPQLSTTMEPIRRLTRQDCEWQWTPEQETAMQELKQLVTSAPLQSVQRTGHTHAPRYHPHAPRYHPHAPRYRPHAPRYHPHAPRYHPQRTGHTVRCFIHRPRFCTDAGWKTHQRRVREAALHSVSSTDEQRRFSR